MKIAIIGIGGSGKTALARILGQKTSLPVFHMDQLFWKGNWEEVPESEYLPKHQELLKKDRWIIEGFIDEKMADRVKQADRVIYLDYSGIRCTWRVIKRWILHRKESRPELPQEAREEFIPKFWWTVFTRAERQGIELALRQVQQSRIVRVHSPRELNIS